MKATLNICLLAVLLTVHTALATKDTPPEYILHRKGQSRFAAAIARIAESALDYYSQTEIQKIQSRIGDHDLRSTLLRNSIPFHSKNSSKFVGRRRALVDWRNTLLKNIIHPHSKYSIHFVQRRRTTWGKVLNFFMGEVFSTLVSVGIKSGFQYVVLLKLLSLFGEFCALCWNVFQMDGAKPPRKSSRHLRHRVGRHRCCKPLRPR